MESSSASSSVKLLSDDGNTQDHGHICRRYENEIIRDTSYIRFSGLSLVLIFGVSQLLLLVLVVLVFHLFQANKGSAQVLDPNDYFALSHYNATKKAYDIVDAADPSPEADRFWHDLQKTDGIVVVNSRWAQQNNLPPTVDHPYEPQVKIYQINVFHSLHCLYRIRNRLISNVTLDKWPRNDVHTMHCLDHIRNSLMCHADISLSGSDEFVSFNVHDHDQKCKDLGAIQRWAREHDWPGYSEYLQTVVGYDPIEAERVNMMTAGEGRWNKAKSTLDKQSGKIELWFED
ncbi:ABC transporter [Colletotrichum tofieldiae]|uniref:ABC transporter n=1 Tax=Colletotrichum tofieldiae TaxID=708197 RepID=A0A166YKZ8_9PEZI|nr:ABC transporter [Colletotrichum tofieldiae]